MKMSLGNYKGLFLVLLLWVSIFLSTIGLPFILITLELESKLSFYLKTFLGQLFAYLLPISILVIATTRRAKSNFQKIGLFGLKDFLKEKNKIKFLPFILLTIIFYLIIHFLTESAANLYLYLTNDFSAVLLNSNVTFSNFLSLILVFAVMPAIIEEITYRGLYFSTFRNNKKLLYFTPTFVFSLSHGSIPSIITSLLLGLFLINVMDVTKSLKLLILLHFVYNFLSLIFSNYIKTPISPSEFIDYNQLPNVILGASLINFAIALALLIPFFKYREKILQNFEKKLIIVKEREDIRIYRKYNYLSSIILCITVIVLFIVRFI